MSDFKSEISSQFAVCKPKFPGASLNWLASARESSLQQFMELDFPTKRNEAWKYTDVKAVAKRALFPSFDKVSSVTAASIAQFLYPDITAGHVVVVDGVVSNELSDLSQVPSGVACRSLEDVLATDSEMLQQYWQTPESSNAFSALNSALATSGVVLEVDSKVQLDKPIQVLYVGTIAGEKSASHIKNIVNIAQGASATLLESYVGIDESSYWHHCDTVINVADSADFMHYKVLDESSKAFHISKTSVSQSATSKYTQHAIQLSGRLLRNDLNIELNGEGAYCHLDGLYLGDKRQHIDNHLLIRHMVPNAESHTLYKGAVADHARGVFNGAIYVERDAQKTEAHLTNNNILLADTAEIDTKPELEIYADDVSCSHGATVGQLEDESLHYLRSRGIDSALAKDILLFAFCSDIVTRIPQDSIRQHLLKRVLAKMPNKDSLSEVLG